MKQDWILVWRYIWSGRGFGAFTTFASLISMTLSVAILILVSGVMTGFEQNFVQKMAAVEGNLQLLPNSLDYKQIASDLRAKNRYDFVLEKINGYALALGASNSTGVLVTGTEINRFLLRSKAKFEGKPNPKVVLGLRLASKLNLGIGDNIRILMPDNSPSPFGWIPNYIDLTIEGLVNTGSNMDSNLVLLDLNQAEKFWSKRQGFIEISCPNWQQEKILLQKEGWLVHDWLENNEIIRSAMEMEKNMMIFVLLLVIILAAFNMALGITMLVQEKSREIALLKAFGYSGKRIFFIFLRVSFFVGILGSLTGTFLGLLVAYRIDLVQRMMELILQKELFNSKIYVTTAMSWSLSLKELIIFCGGTVFLVTLGGIIPAVRAYRANIMEILRNDL